ncbi:MAG: YicC/YloC family endoribonuclease [Longimicrobiales bacterium]
MIRSMTGFGDAERDTPAGRLRLEVKTVNHRFFNTSIKTPSGYDRLEPVIAGALKGHIARGHVSAFLSVDRSSLQAEDALRVDLEKAAEYRAALEHIQSELAVPGQVDLAMLARFGDIFRAPDRRAEAPDLDEAVVADLADEVARSVVRLRQAEGQRLRDDMEGRLSAMAAELDVVAERAPERLTSERDRLRNAVRELSEQMDIDEDRLAREIAYLAEKWDINEELVRFRSHIELFREALEADGADPVGKRLGFLVQEMHREANTIGSKANDARISHAAVAIKEEIERLREQVENVE